MKKQIGIAPPNSIIFVTDHTYGESPAELDDGLITVLPSCVAVGTLSATDGRTTIILTDEIPQAGFEGALVFDGMIETQSKRLAVCSALDEVLIELPVESTETKVQIWANDDWEPDQIAVATLPSSGKVDEMGRSQSGAGDESRCRNEKVP